MSTAFPFALDAAQQAAAASPTAVQLVLAGPGSGKTTTLAARHHHLVRQGIDPRRILAVTFTRKAADEMRSRIGASLGLPPETRLPVMTFHAFAFRQLRANPAAAGLKPGFALWGALQQRHVFHSRQMWWNEETDILDIIDGMKERLVDAAGLAQRLSAPGAKFPDYFAEAVKFFRVYEQALEMAGAIDFADMVPRLDAAMLADEAYRRRVTGAFEHLLVDEFQDVNAGQMQLVSRFVEDGARLWAVGDEDQTLFTFRASDVRHILEFSRRHPTAEIHLLENNYRSDRNIVGLARTLIRGNASRNDKDLRAIRQQLGEVVVRGYSTPEVEARQVAEAIARLLKQGTPAAEVAVLYRAGAIGLELQTILKERGIPFEVRGSGDLWQSVAARLVVGALHYLEDGPSLAATSRLGNGRRARLIGERLDEVRRKLRLPFAEALRHAGKVVADSLPGSAPERERGEWRSVIDAVGLVAADCHSLADLERRIAEQSAMLRRVSPHAVVLSTVHSAKGLEWDAVFVLGLEEGVLPNANAQDIEEERRIAYVAMTRARRILGLTYVARRYGRSASPSRFLAEIKGAADHVRSGPRAMGADQRLPLVDAGDRRRRPFRVRFLG
ncbi:MAG TPA: ATP-dependent helicase [Rhodospirillaceae bacterium]|nr:ATP-dependent helicase [Rhodospirillaceae bacterium]